MKTKLQKIKIWTKEHADDLLVGTLAIGGGAACIVLYYSAVKDMEEENRRIRKYVAEVNEWRTEQYSKGLVPVQLADGSWLSVKPEELA